MVYPHNGIIFSNKKELATDSHYRMDELQKHAMWRKPDRKGHLLYGPIYLKYPEKQIYRDKK